MGTDWVNTPTVMGPIMAMTGPMIAVMGCVMAVMGRVIDKMSCVMTVMETCPCHDGTCCYHNRLCHGRVPVSLQKTASYSTSKTSRSPSTNALSAPASRELTTVGHGDLEGHEEEGGRTEGPPTCGGATLE